MKAAHTSQLRAALDRSRSALVTVGWLSAIINVLLLGGPLYMLLIYDSVMPSGSTATLFGLLAMIVVIYAFQGLFDLLRTRMLSDIAAGLEARMTGRVHRAMTAMGLRAKVDRDDGLTPMRDLDSIRSFLASPGPGALMDLPWLVLFLGLLTMLHYWLGLTALVGALVLIAFTILNDRLTRRPGEELSGARAYRSKLAQDTHRHVEVIRALGMGERMHDAWHVANAQLSSAQDRVARTTSLIMGLSRVFRMFLQSVVLTVGALLYLAGEASGGIVFAASILAARALAPIDQAIMHWGSFTAARQSWARLDALFEAIPEDEEIGTQLPAPESALKVGGLAVAPPGAQEPVLRDISFDLAAGDAMGIIGPSAAGKTTLARALVGVWAPLAGTVRLDGASLDQWEPDTLGAHLGYLPQHVELFDGTIAQNIARFDPEPPFEAVIAAGRAGGVHELVLALPNGYDTRVGGGGIQLSAGQRQRIGLARALYRQPFLVVLDEPNSNLDAEGEAALDGAIAEARERGAIVVLIAHRPSALRKVNKVLVLQQGRQVAFGERDKVLASLLSQPVATPIRPAGSEAAETPANSQQSNPPQASEQVRTTP
ncbi:type I secretion system permease/ATPase [Porphyrobacter sp. AAP60]|uniref:type I secretion system permease/ATPase n=1 Tax=Porphyrobacter sp. AAP60 TaxID=1523423 RepID=UPI0009E6F949|nr:type I secretion system permease/ATPase [Porphyrobacter sp. AAP60]